MTIEVARKSAHRPKNKVTNHELVSLLSGFCRVNVWKLNIKFFWGMTGDDGLESIKWFDIAWDASTNQPISSHDQSEAPSPTSMAASKQIRKARLFQSRYHDAIHMLQVIGRGFCIQPKIISFICLSIGCRFEFLTSTPTNAYKHI